MATLPTKKLKVEASCADDNACCYDETEVGDTSGQSAFGPIALRSAVPPSVVPSMLLPLDWAAW